MVSSVLTVTVVGSGAAPPSANLKFSLPLKLLQEFDIYNKTLPDMKISITTQGI